MAHTLYCTKISLNLVSPTVQATLQEVVGGPIGIRDIHSVRHRCGIVYTYLCTYEKEVAENFSPVTCIGEIGENFLLMKISAYKV